VPRVKSLSLVAAIVAVAFFSIACSSSSNNTPTGAAPPPAQPGTSTDFESAVAARAKSFCDRVFDCCDAAAKSTLLQPYNNADGSADACATAVKASLKVATTSVVTAMGKKELQFFPSKEADCLKADDAKSCSDFFAAGPATQPTLACSAAFTGTGKDGATCALDGACASGFCKLDGSVGVCAAKPAEGDPCGSTPECGSDGTLYCHRTVSPPDCKYTDGVCKVKDASKKDGSTCCEPEECASGSCKPTNKGPQCVPADTFKCSQ
jgi:hypothetical protein